VTLFATYVKTQNVDLAILSYQSILEREYSDTWNQFIAQWRGQKSCSSNQKEDAPPVEKIIKYDNIGYSTTPHLCSKTHTSTGTEGVCITKTKCAEGKGITVSKLCPNDSADVLCCAGGNIKITVKKESNGDCGPYTSAQTQNIQGNKNVTYKVVKILKQHLADQSYYNYGPYDKDNTFTLTMACAWSKLFDKAASQGVYPKISSAFRTIKRQQYFYNCMNCKCCNNGNPAAYPGTSKHGIGKAVDINTSCGKQYGSTPPSACRSNSIYKWMVANGKTYGIIRTVQSEPWHWEHWPGKSNPHYA
jgi:hypothetical protein